MRLVATQIGYASGWAFDFLIADLFNHAKDPKQQHSANETEDADDYGDLPSPLSLVSALHLLQAGAMGLGVLGFEGLKLAASPTLLFVLILFFLLWLLFD